MCDERHYEPILGRLQCLRRTKRGWEAYCPIHEADGQKHRPSFYAEIGTTGALVVGCRVCRLTLPQVAAALGVHLSAFFPPDEQRSPKARKTRRNRPAAQYTAKTPKPPKEPRRMSTDAPQQGASLKLVAEYDYFDENNTYQYTIVRYEPKTFRIKRRGGAGQADQWGQGDSKLVLYNLPALIAADPKRLVVVCEGEKDVNRLKALGILAVTNPFGAGKWRPTFSDWLTSRHVLVIADHDEAGERHGKEVANHLLGKAKTLKYLQFTGYPPKSDVTTFLEMGGTKEELQEITKKLPVVSEPFVLPTLAAAPAVTPPAATQPASVGRVVATQEATTTAPAATTPATEGAATDGPSTRPAGAQGGALAVGLRVPGSGEALFSANLEKPLNIQHVARLARQFAKHERLVLAQAILADVQLEIVSQS